MSSGAEELQLFDRTSAEPGAETSPDASSDPGSGEKQSFLRELLSAL